MRYVSLLLITLFFASCGNQKMRFVRNNHTKQKVIELAEISSLKKSVESNARTETPSSELEKISSEQNSERTSDQLPSAENTENSEAKVLDIEPSFPIITEDSVKLTAAETEEITDKALKAQKLGSWSLVLSILVYVLAALAGIVLAVSFIGEFYGFIFFAAFLMIASFASMVSSLVLGILSLRAQYNTPQGRRRAIAGVLISSLMLLLLLVNVVLSI